MIEFLLVIFGVFFQLFLMNLWAGIFLHKRNKNTFRTVLLNFICCSMLIFSNLYLIDLLFQVATFFFCMLIIFLNHAPFDFRMLFCDFIFCVFFICGKMVGQFALAVSLNDAGIPFLSGRYGFIPGVIANMTTLILSWTGYLFFKQNKMVAEISFKNFIVTLFLPISSLFILIGLLSGDADACFFTLIGILGLAVSNILGILYAEKNAVIEEQRIKASFLEKQIAIQKNYYTQMEKNRLEVMKIRHNLKNTLLALSGYAEANDVEAIKDYLMAGSEEWSVLDKNRVVYTGYSAIDRILTEKKNIAKNKQIKIKMKFDLLPSLFWINEMDLCIILSNALDNAIEACEKITENQKNIALSLKLSEESMKMVLVNTICKINLPDHSDLKTTKKNKQEHGFGLQTMEQIAGKYNGVVRTETEKGCFRLTVILFH